MNADDAYRRCLALFADYPQAADQTAITVDSGQRGTATSMVLMVADGEGATFFILCLEGPAGSPFSLFPWRAQGVTLIRPGRHALSVRDADVLDRCVPIPRHGSLFGWVSGTVITALISAYTTYSPQSPVPSWAVMPCVDGSRDQWPPFTFKKMLGRWFWEYVRAGTIRDMHRPLAATRGTVFRVDTADIPGSSCCVVARDLRTMDGLVLRKGRYIPYQAALSGDPLPSLDMLLTGPGRADLSPSFSDLQSAECG